jgi:hypothetical protein
MPGNLTGADRRKCATFCREHEQQAADTEDLRSLDLSLGTNALGAASSPQCGNSGQEQSPAEVSDETRHALYQQRSRLRRH